MALCVSKIMAKEYFEKLDELVSLLGLEGLSNSQLEVKHFFSGAALYINGSIRCSWSPLGLAFKLPNGEAERLIEKGQATPLKYFEKGHIKKGYAMFQNPHEYEQGRWLKYFKRAIDM